MIDFLRTEMGVDKIRFPESSGIGIKPVSEEGTRRLVPAAIQYAIDNGRPSVTLVHKGNIMKYTEGSFMNWGYKVAAEEFGAEPLDGGPWHKMPNGIIVKDMIADAMLQQILTRPAEYAVLATLNLNGDYISDALAAQVGGGSALRRAQILIMKRGVPSLRRPTVRRQSMRDKTRSTPLRSYSAGR